MKTKIAVVLLILFGMGGSAFAQVNNARMLSTPNAQTGTSYTFVPADTTRVTTFNNASAVAVSLPNGATFGFGAGTMLSVVNLGAGQVTITCSSCTINGVATLVLSQNSGADIYGGTGTSAVNYVALPSPTGANFAALGGNNAFTGNNTFAQVNKICFLDGVTNTTLAQAVACAGASGTIEVPPSAGTITVPSNISIPNNVTLKMDQGALLSIANGATLTFAVGAQFVSQPDQAFIYVGTGKVSGLTGIVEATWFPGADLGAAANNAFTACNAIAFTGCTVHISSGNFSSQSTYTYTTTINYPVPTGGAGNARLWCSEGVLLSYTGSGYAVEAKATAANQINADNVRISGCHILGQPTGLGGIHLYVVSTVNLEDNEISGFTGQNAAGILNEGSTTLYFAGNNVRNNAVGLHNTCVLPVFTTVQCAIGMKGFGNHWQSNLGPGIWEDSGVQFGQSFLVGGNLYSDNIEGNGGQVINPITVSSGTATGSLTSNLVTITVASTTGLVNGMIVVQSGFTSACSLCYNGRYTISNLTSTTYQYNYSNANVTSTTGTIVAHIPQVNLKAAISDVFNAGFMQTTFTSGMLCEICIGDSVDTPLATDIEKTQFGSLGVISTIDQYQGTGTVVQANQERIAVTNFFNGAVSGGTVRAYVTRNTSAATNYYAGFADVNTEVIDNAGNHYMPNVAFTGTSGVSGNLNKLVATQPTGQRTTTLQDASGTVPLIIASGTTTLTANAALAAVTSQAANTTAATNALTTDTIVWAFATAPGAGDNLCHVLPYVTAGNVNFVRTNPTAAAQNVTALVINWRVIR